MWSLNEVDSTNYVLLITVLIILGILALLAFGSLPCSCKYICLLNHCLWKRNTGRVTDSGSNSLPNHSNRLHVINAGIPDPESLVQFPIYPFATEPHPNLHLPGQLMSGSSSRQPLRVVHVHEDLGLSSLPCYYEYYQNQLKFPPTSSCSEWEEPPPSYEAIFPMATLPMGGPTKENEISLNSTLHYSQF